MPVYDVVVVGGGIVGLATARELLLRAPGRALVVLEKEPQVAVHQTGHNSGVIHSGVYYRPGSLKAQYCVNGAELLVEFCQAHSIPYKLSGKVIVATEEPEVSRLTTLYERGLANRVPGISMVGSERLRELEPHARGLRALHIPRAGIVDYGAVARVLAQLIQSAGGQIRTGAQVTRLDHKEGAWRIETTAGEMSSKFLITCAGLHADRIAKMGGAPSDVRIVPFRGEYYELVPERRFLINGMIYPVPDPTLPFLGVHFTRTIDGGVHVGPNAVLAFKREGYRKTDVDLSDMLGMLGFAGFWRMAQRYWTTGMRELYRSLSKQAFIRAAQRLVPEVRGDDLSGWTSGVRAQALDSHGTLLDDFEIVQSHQAIHVRNVPSPAATASLAIGKLIAQMAGRVFGLSGAEKTVAKSLEK